MSLRALLLVGFVLSVLAVTAPSVEAGHSALHVLGNADFAAKGWTGSGTLSDPYRLPAGVTIVQAAQGSGIRIENTDAYVNLTGVTITGGGSHSDGISLLNASRVTIHGVTLEANRAGIAARASSSLVIASTTVKSSQVGIQLDDVRGAQLRDNQLAVNDKNVDLRVSMGNTFLRNNLSVATGQYGLFFQDNVSYDNAIDPSNVVNAIPVRWYTGLMGSSSAPIVIADATVDLPRMTNVAQIMVANSAHVKLERATAKAGAGVGIHVHKSAHVELVAPIADGNALHGLFIEQSDGTRVENASFRNNLATGALVRSAFNTTLLSSTLSGNAQAGIQLGPGTNHTTLRALSLLSNAGGAVSADAARNLTLDQSALTSNGATEIALSNARDAVVQNNTISGAGATAIRAHSSIARIEANRISGHATGVAFVASTGSNVSANEITLVANGFGLTFDGPGSYDNVISTTNTVNGTAVQWYTNVVGPTTLSDLRVETRGITNVAQIMLYRSNNVTLVAPVATRGSAAGIVIHGSHDVNVSSGTARENVGQGVLATGGSGLRVFASSLTLNGGDGLKLFTSDGALLENNIVSSNSGRGMAVETSGRPTLRGNAVTGSGGAGMVFSAVGPGGAAADHNTLLANRGGGIVATSSVIGSLFSNTLRDNGADGISLSNVPVGARLDANTIVNHSQAIRLAGASGTEFTGNQVTIATGQTGIHFADEASYNVSLAPSNTVNGVPLRWYVGVNNTTISDVRVELPGMTNVAQVMFYRSANVTLTGAVASNGTSRGIFVLSSQDMRIEGARAENNTRAGIQLDATRAVRVNGSASRLNAQEGILVRESASAWISNTTAEDDRGPGILLTASGGAGARLEDLLILRNRDGIKIESSNVSRIHGANVQSNGLVGLLLSGATVGNVTNNSIADHARNVELSNVAGITFEGNLIAKLANQTGWHFAHANAYANTVGPSNVVNGVPMRWYSGIAGLDLSGVRVELAGITNVAQVMLRGVSDANVTDLWVANGTGHGVYVLSSQRILVNGSTTQNNTGNGLLAELSTSIAFRNSTARANQGAGVRDLQGAADTLDNATLVANGRAGAEASLSSQWSVSSSTVTSNVGGITLDRVMSPAIRNTTLTDNGLVGIQLLSSTSARVTGARITDHAKGIELRDTEFGEFHGNEITIRDGQTGFHFGDERSYNNVIPTSNTVNAQPVHWYVTLSGTELAPVTLNAVRSELKGITNVAQVMVYRSAYVRLHNTVATNGTAHGVVLHRSSSVTLENANASANALAAVHLYATQSANVSDLQAVDTTTGVLLTDSSNNIITRVNATGATVGVSLTSASSRDDRIDQVTTNGTARGILDAAWNGAGLSGNNLAVDAGAPKRAKAGVNVSFSDAMATYRLEASRIVEQTFSFGDGSSPVTSTVAALLRPVHAYAAPGIYQANFTARTADGLTLTDHVFVEIVPPLSAPRALVAQAGARNATLSWDAPASDGASPITSYQILRGTNESNLAPIKEVPGASRAYVDEGLVNGMAYLYRVFARNAEEGGPVATVTVTPVGPPAAPTALKATPGPRTVTLNWSAPSDTGGVPMGGYVVMRIMNGTPAGSMVTLGNLTGVIVPDLTNGLEYTFAVRGYNGLGAGALSTHVAATPLGPPGPPVGVRALAGDASATLVWSVPLDNGGTNVTGYRVLRSGANGSFTELPVKLPFNATSHRDTGLSNGQTYTYAIVALNKVGASERSASQNATPSALDALAPIVFDHFPPEGAKLIVSPVTISARYTDNEGIVVDSVRVYLDGAQVGANLSVEGFEHAPPTALSFGDHTVRVVLRDPSGNEANATWSFRILSEEEQVARFVVSDRAFVPDRVTPGENVTARASVRNTGFVPGELTLSLRLHGSLLGYAELALDGGEAQDVFVEFSAPTLVGEYVLDLGGENMTLTVADPEVLKDEAHDDGAEDAPAKPSPVTPTRPERSTPSPRVAETPFPAPVLLLALVAVVAWLRRKG